MKQELSILIPIYNNDCRQQVTELCHQAEAVNGLTYEIVVANDGSTEAAVSDWLSDISQMKNVRCIRREQNVGRAAIRNFLAREAKYNWLLFMDGDMAIPSETFVKNWLEADISQLGYGGYIVGKGEASSLRYIYEKQCEPMHRAEERKKRPFQHFHTCNFLINKELMLLHPFDERFRQYGYEDVLFGKQLRQAGVNIEHIENPAGFFDYENNAHFVSKTEEGLRTLYEFRNDLRGYSQMITFAEGIHIKAIRGFIVLWHRIFRKMERNNLCGKKPNLRVFKLYKLGYYLSLMKNEKVKS